MDGGNCRIRCSVLGFCWGAEFPVVALDKATVEHPVFVDDLPLVIGVGVLQHRAVGS